MKTLPIAVIALTAALCGCSTTQDIVLVKASGAKRVATVVQMPEDGNSPEMTMHLTAALANEGVTVKGQAAPGVQKAKDVDAVVSYIDFWRWDLAMYLHKLSIRIYDAESGDLLVMGNWSDSPLHGFRNAKLVVEGMVKDMMAKLRGAVQK